MFGAEVAVLVLWIATAALARPPVLHGPPRGPGGERPDRAGRAALRAAAVGMPANSPGGVIIEVVPAWGATAAGAVPAGTDAMKAAFQVANDCFAQRFSVDPLGGAGDGWSVVVDATVGPGGGIGPAIVSGIDLEGELECLESGLASVYAEGASPHGLTFRITSSAPQPQVGEATAHLDVGAAADDPITRVRALRFEIRARDVALACARRLGPPPAGTYRGDGAILRGVPADFADCWAELAPALEAWTDGSSAFTLDYTGVP
jgi:hypothetical protein